MYWYFHETVRTELFTITFLSGTAVHFIMSFPGAPWLVCLDCRRMVYLWMGGWGEGLEDGIFVNGRMRRRFEWWYIYEWVDEEKVWRMVYLWMGGWGEGLKDGIFMNGWMRRRFEWWYICKWVDEEKDGMMVYLWMGGWEKGFEWWHICELVDEKKVHGRQMMISSLV